MMYPHPHDDDYESILVHVTHTVMWDDDDDDNADGDPPQDPSHNALLE